MARTPTSEILLTIQAVKQLQVDLTTLAKVVETIGERLVQLEMRADAPRNLEGPSR
jgi:hypothetical protein